MKPLIDHLECKLDASISRIEKVETRVDRHDTKLTNIDSKLDDIEQYQRKDNIRIIGLAQNVGKETPAKVANFIKQTLQIDITINIMTSTMHIDSPAEIKTPAIRTSLCDSPLIL